MSVHNNDPNKGGTTNPSGPGAISDALNSAGVRSSQFSGQSPNQNQNQQRASRGSANQPAILNINALLGGPMARSAAAGHVLGFQKAINTKLDDNISDAQRPAFQVHVMDRSQGIALATILLCHVVQQGGENHVGVYSMVVEASGDSKIPSRYVNIGNLSVEVEQVAGDTINRELWEKTVLFLRDQYGGKSVFHDAGAMVLPNELSPDDVDRLYQTTFTAIQALYAVLEGAVTAQSTPISVKMTEGAVITATLDPNPPELFNAVGMPVRNDISVSVRASSANTNQTSLHEAALDLTVVNGFMDLIYTKPQMPPVVNPYVAIPSQHYYPRFVITSLDTRVRAITLELWLLALASAPLIGRQWAWTNAFLPRYTDGSGPDLRDVGAIGFEINPTNDPQATPERIPTKSDSFSRKDLFDLLQRWFHEEVVYSLDVEEAAPLSWLTQTFIAAANGNSVAYTAIVEACNNLTDGKFSLMWNNGAIAEDDQNRIHLGTYVDTAGRKRDIRDLGYLGMLNLIGEKDKPAFDEYIATFEQTQMPQEMRMATRAKILNAVTRGQFVLKGYARRITFTNAFIATLDAAVQQAGLQIRPNNVQLLEGQGQSRGNFNASQFAVSNSVGAGTFSHNQTPYGNYRNSMNQPWMGNRFSG